MKKKITNRQADISLMLMRTTTRFTLQLPRAYVKITAIYQAASFRS